MDTIDNNAVDLSSLGSFDFTPDWAKQGSVVTVTPQRSEKAVDSSPEKNAPRERSKFGERKPFKDRRRSFEVRERVFPLDAEIKILPEPKALGTIFKKIERDFHAYKLKDLAFFFLDNLDSVLLKITPSEKFGSFENKYFQCKACGFVSSSEESLIEHILSAHLADYYNSQVVECEPPTGNFNCVAKCSLTGVLLGPPNIHEFNSNVKEMIRTRFPGMSESEYRSHIEMIRDSAVIDEWRNSAHQRTVYFEKGAGENALPKSRAEAEGEMRRTVVDALLARPSKNLMITAAAALKSGDKPLVLAVKDALRREGNRPYSMIFALRGAFHHRKLKFFKANDSHGQEFVSSVEYREFDAAHAVPELAGVANFIVEHPCSTKEEIVSSLGEDSLKHLSQLVSTGHVVSFTNGVYSAVEKFPKYGPEWRKVKNNEATDQLVK